MVVPDVNLLVHAHNSTAARHDVVQAWWRELLSGQRPVGLAWVAALGFVRVSTNRRAVARPLAVQDAIRQVRGWLARPNVTILHPGERHAEILFGLLEHLGVGGNMTTDAHLAALAIEYQAEIYSTDADFARFPGLRWRNPLK